MGVEETEKSFMSNYIQQFFVTHKMLETNKISYHAPYIVNGSFCAEICLKYLLKENGIQYSRKHLFFKLVQLLPTALKAELYDSIRKRNNFSDNEIEDKIKFVSDNFCVFRYGFEQDICITDITFLEIFIDTLYQMASKGRIFAYVDITDIHTESKEDINTKFENAERLYKEIIEEKLR